MFLLNALILSKFLKDCEKQNMSEILRQTWQLWASAVEQVL